MRDRERLGAHHAVRVGQRVQVAERRGGIAERLQYRDRDGGALQRGGAGIGGDGVLGDECRRRATGPAARRLEHEEHRQHHVPGALHRSGELAVGIEFGFGFLQDFQQRALGWRRFHQLAERAVDALVLRLGEEDEVADGARLRLRQQVDHLRVRVTRPRPATDVVDTLFVDRDDRHLVGRRARCAADGEVVGLALQARQEIGQPMKRGEQDHDSAAERPVGFPESRSHCGARLPLLSRKKILR